MKRREFLKTTGIAAGAAALPQLARSATNDRRPNVLLIMTDDQGWGDIHTHGNEKLDTPVMDQLAAAGARFDRFYVSPVCSPTRASLLTGRYHERTGVSGVTRTLETMRADEVTVAQVFKAAGYATACFGKWHNGAHYPYHPNGKGFDEFLGFCAGHWNNYFDTHLDHNGTMVKTQGYITDVLTDAALDWIAKNQERPFFCYIPYNAPHSPWQVPDKYFDKYKARGFSDTVACAYGMVENLDDNIGRLLAKLDDLKLTDDTIVLFLTDNGANSDRFNGGMKGRKGSSDEGGVRVPLFVRWQGHIKPGTVVPQIAAHIDMLPTLVALSGIPMIETKPIDGKNLEPLLMGRDVDWPDRILFTHWNRGGAARTQRWRAVKSDRPGRWQLYDMVADPEQKKNVGNENPAVLKKLSAAYDAWLADATKGGCVPIPTPIGHPGRAETTLPGHEAFLEPRGRKGISYCGSSGWANDWVTNWTDTNAYPYWEVDVVQAGRYDVTLMYTCPKENVGTEVRVEIGEASVAGKIEKAHDPKPLPSPDRVPRKEVYEKVWAPLHLGTMELPKGQARLMVRALSKPGRTVVDLKAVVVRLTD